jgi:hypothetical protein
MHNSVQYKVEINCGPSPSGTESHIASQLGENFPVIDCQTTQNGLTIFLKAANPVADGALKDMADQITEILSSLGITLNLGVIRRVCKRSVSSPGVFDRVQNVAATLTGFDLRPAREVPVLYFYKGLRFDLDLSTRMTRKNPAGQVNFF